MSYIEHDIREVIGVFPAADAKIDPDRLGDHAAYYALRQGYLKVLSSGYARLTKEGQKAWKQIEGERAALIEQRRHNRELAYPIFEAIQKASREVQGDEYGNPVVAMLVEAIALTLTEKDRTDPLFERGDRLRSLEWRVEEAWKADLKEFRR